MRMENTMRNQSDSNYLKYVLALLFTIGTGCLLVLLWKQNDLLKQMNEEGSRCLVELGFQGNGIVEYMNNTQKEGKGYSWFTDSVPILSYFEESQGELEGLSDKNVESLAMLYPGKNSSNVFWSGAANERILDSCFSSEILEGGMEDDSLEAAVIAENETSMEEVTEKAAVEEKKDLKEIKEDNLTDSKERLLSNEKKLGQLKSTQSLSYLLKNFYIVDSSTSIDKKVFDVENLLKTNLTLKKKNEPQILIFHSHGASESFRDSKPGSKEESIIGVGRVLTEILEEKYGYKVIHDETEYDMINGKIDRNKAYNQAYEGIQKHLKKYPGIEVIIDLHRDGAGDSIRRITTINGKKTAQVMFFNGLSRNSKGNIKYLKNENLQSNLAFSLQLKMKSMEMYSDFTKPVYLKGYRYNLHFRKRSLLIELGNQNNTLQDARNAMEPLAKVLNQVLSEK